MWCPFCHRRFLGLAAMKAHMDKFHTQSSDGAISSSSFYPCSILLMSWNNFSYFLNFFLPWQLESELRDVLWLCQLKAVVNHACVVASVRKWLQMKKPWDNITMRCTFQGKNLTLSPQGNSNYHSTGELSREDICNQILYSFKLSFSHLLFVIGIVTGFALKCLQLLEDC